MPTAQAWVAWNPQLKEKSNSRRHTPHTLTSTKQGGRSKRCSSKVLENWLLFKHKKLILSQEHSTKSSMDSENVFLNVGIRIMLNVRTKSAMTVGIAFPHREKENTGYLVAFCFLLTPLQQGVPLRSSIFSCQS